MLQNWLLNLKRHFKIYDLLTSVIRHQDNVEAILLETHRNITFVDLQHISSNVRNKLEQLDGKQEQKAGKETNS